MHLAQLFNHLYLLVLSSANTLLSLTQRLTQQQLKNLLSHSLPWAMWKRSVKNKKQKEGMRIFLRGDESYILFTYVTILSDLASYLFDRLTFAIASKSAIFIIRTEEILLSDNQQNIFCHQNVKYFSLCFSAHFVSHVLWIHNISYPAHLRWMATFLDDEESRSIVLLIWNFFQRAPSKLKCINFVKA